jgi:hypothetical protein
MTQRELAAISSPIAASYIRSAFFMAERAKQVELSPPSDAFEWTLLHHSLVTSSILSSTCALEANINEWFSYPEEIAARPRPSTGLRIQKMWSLGVPRTASFQILQKYQIGLALAEGSTFEEGSEPFQSARLLVELRNWLVHYEPTWEPIPAHEETGHFPPHKLMRRLRGKFSENPLCHKDAPYWPYKCLGAGCSIWAAEAAFALIDAFFEQCDPKSTSRPDRALVERAREYGRRKADGTVGG